MRPVLLFPLQKLTLRRAEEQSLRTARLPIREYMVKAANSKNYHSETLAINQGEGLSCCSSPVLSDGETGSRGCSCWV